MIDSIIHKSNAPTEFLPHTKKLLKEDSLTIRVIKVASIAFLVYAIVLDISYNVNRLFSQKVLPLKQKLQFTNQKKLFKIALIAVTAIGAMVATYALGGAFFKREVGEKIIENIIPTPPVSNISNSGLWALMTILAAFALRRCFSSSNTKELSKAKSGKSDLVDTVHNLPKDLESIEISLDQFRQNPNSVIPDLQRLFDRHRGEIFPGTERRRANFFHSKKGSEDGSILKPIIGSSRSLLKQIVSCRDCPIIFKLCRHTQFNRRGNPIKVTGDNESLLINVERRMANYQRAVKAAEGFDRIVIPKTIAFNYEFSHKGVSYNFPVLAQERVIREKKEDNSPLLVSELFKSPAVNLKEKSKIIRNLILFLLKTGFKDVREENLYVVRQNGQYKIAFFDFEEMDSNDKYTPFYGCNNPEIPGLFKIIIPEVQLEKKRGKDCLKLMDAFSEDRPNQDLASVS